VDSDRPSAFVPRNSSVQIEPGTTARQASLSANWVVSLPNEPFLAARIDGAGPVRTFLSVTFPMMGAISVGAILIRMIEASKLMETIYVLTSGGPGTSTETTSYYIYIRGMRDFQIGYSAALSLTYLIVMCIALTLIAKALTRLVVKDRT